MTSLLEVAAAPTLNRIRRDHEKAPMQVRPLLAYLEEHLFDPGLDGLRLRQACGVRDNSLPVLFSKVVHLPPYAYIEDCRLEVACRLLRDTELKLWQIAQRLGYSTLQVFSRAFDRWSGMRPSVFRGRCHLWKEGPGRRAMAAPRPIRVETLRRALNGELTRGEADKLVRRLVELYPESFRAPPAFSGFQAEASAGARL